MSAVFDAFWRAVAYCLMPRVMLLSVLPLLFLMSTAGVLAWLFWEEGVASVRLVLDESAAWSVVLEWLEELGAAGLRAVLAPLILVALALPVLVVASLLLVAQFMTPALVRLVAVRRFGSLQRRGEGSVVWALLRGLGLSLLAVALMVLSLPLWLVPPVALLVGPLVWGWLTMQVLSWDVMAEHADEQERDALIKAHRWPLLAMGVVCGLLGSAPTGVWALSALTLVLAPLVMVASVWIYTAVFTFTSLWFAHYLLAALHELRQLPLHDEPLHDEPPPHEPPPQGRLTAQPPRLERTP